MQRLLLILLAGTLLLTACGGGDSDSANAIPSDALFADTFTAGSSGDWLIEGDELGQSAIINDQMLISVNAANTLQFTTLTAPLFTDFTLVVDAAILSGDPQSTYGVLFRMQSPQQFYRFELMGTGKYMLERRDADGSWTRLLPDWADAPAINTGLNAVNRLQVEARGPNIAVSVNDQLLFRTVDNAYTIGTIGLDAGTFGATNLQVAFDNLVVTDP